MPSFRTVSRQFHWNSLRSSTLPPCTPLQNQVFNQTTVQRLNDWTNSCFVLCCILTPLWGNNLAVLVTAAPTVTLLGYFPIWICLMFNSLFFFFFWQYPYTASSWLNLLDDHGCCFFVKPCHRLNFLPIPYSFLTHARGHRNFGLRP